MMSRLCVKNLPKYVDNDALRKHFESQGSVTDARVLRTKDGRSRQLGFIGFETEQQALAAKKYFHKSFFDTCRLNVEVALPYGDQGLRRPWSKHSKTNSESVYSKKKEVKKKAPAKKVDKKLEEFLALMQPRSKAQFWTNDDVAPSQEEVPQDPPSGEDVSDDEKPTEKEKKPDEPDPALSGRLFVRNLSFKTSEDDLRELFKQFGPIAEVHIPVNETNRSRGYGYVLYVVPEHATKALAGTDGKIFQGRLIHVLPAVSKPSAAQVSQSSKGSGQKSSYKSAKDEKLKSTAQDSQSWNSLFVRSDAAVSAVANAMGISKGDMFDETSANASEDIGSAIRVAISETKVIAETKEFMAANGVDLEVLEKGIVDPSKVERSSNCILVKNLPHDSNVQELRQLFTKYGSLERFVIPPSKTMALVKFHSSKDAQKAFRSLAFKRYKRVPVFLEWAPANTIKSAPEDKPTTDSSKVSEVAGTSVQAPDTTSALTEGSIYTLYIKNLNFNTTEKELLHHFGSIAGKESVKHVTIPLKTNGLSMGYGFVEMMDEASCRRALGKGNESTLNGHILSVKLSKQASTTAKVVRSKRKHASLEASEPTTTSDRKLLIRNLAFEATKKELKQLFSVYGQINSIRLPKKYDGTHRGFAFIDFVTHEEAKSAYSALAATHLYGRKLVIEWAANNSESLTKHLAAKPE